MPVWIERNRHYKMKGPSTNLHKQRVVLENQSAVNINYFICKKKNDSESKTKVPRSQRKEPRDTQNNSQRVELSPNHGI